MTDEQTLPTSGKGNRTAKLVAILLMMPAYIAGWLAGEIYFFFRGLMLASGPSTLWTVILPDLIRGTATAATALGVTYAILKPTNRQDVATTTLIVWIAIILGLTLFTLAMHSANPDLLTEGIAFSAGIVAGGLLVARAK